VPGGVVGEGEDSAREEARGDRRRETGERLGGGDEGMEGDGPVERRAVMEGWTQEEQGWRAVGA
jgi:hypothetical protein